MKPTQSNEGKRQENFFVGMSTSPIRKATATSGSGTMKIWRQFMASIARPPTQGPKLGASVTPMA